MPTILPTGTCFEDSVWILADLVRRGCYDAILVHAIINPYGQEFSHAWVELGDRALFKGHLDGELVQVNVPREAYYEEVHLVECTRYTLLEAITAEKSAGMPGPWEERYRRLCRN